MSSDWQIEDEFDDIQEQGPQPSPEDRELIEDHVHLPERGTSVRPRQIERYIQIGEDGTIQRRTRSFTTIHCCGHQNTGTNAGGVCAISSRLMCDRCNDVRCMMCRRLACPAHTILHPDLGAIVCDHCYRPVRRNDEVFFFLGAVAIVLLLIVLFLG